MRILVTGSRRLRSDAGLVILHAIEEHRVDGERLTIMEGGGDGADRIARVCADMLGANAYKFPAEWRALGLSAGGERNQEMIDTLPPDVVLAFPDRASKGTWDMVRRAEEAGIKVVVDRTFM